MSANNSNSTPGADLPMAWAIDDFGIPIAVAVGSNPQEIHTEYAETPIVPIAILVEPTAQITELERANIQMAEKAQAQERALKEEKIKQQKQQQELEQAQKKLQQAQQNLTIENEFNLKQMRSLEEYTSRMNLALEYRQLGNFDKAIQQYNLSINSIEKLCTTYKNKEYAKGNLFVTVPDNYNNYILQSRFEIANCLIYKGELEQAYDSLASISRTGTNSYAIETRQRECRDLIYTRAQKLIAEVVTMSTRGNPSQVAAAKNLLQNAQKLLIKISQGNDSNLVTQIARVEWDAIRDQINQECRRLLTTSVELNTNNYYNLVNIARGIIAKYSANATLLDSYELDCQTNIINMSHSFEHIAAQLKIIDLTSTAENYLCVGDIPGAYLVMHEIYNLAVQIKNPYYLQQKGLIYQNPQNYYLQLQNLDSEVQQFKLRSSQKHQLIVDKIIETVLRKLVAKTTNASLLEKDLNDLRDTLSSIIQEKWHKFDRRSDPIDLINIIAEKIVSNCDNIGIFKKWYHWSYATSCLKDPNKILVAVKQQVCDYVPTMSPDVVININNGIRPRHN